MLLSVNRAGPVALLSAGSLGIIIFIFWIARGCTAGRVLEQWVYIVIDILIDSNAVDVAASGKVSCLIRCRSAAY